MSLLPACGGVPINGAWCTDVRLLALRPEGIEMGDAFKDDDRGVGVEEIGRSGNGETRAF